MKVQGSTSARRSVAMCAAHGQQTRMRKGAAVVLGAALQLAVLNHGVADAISLSKEEANKVIDDQASKVENVLDKTANAINGAAEPQV